MKVIFHIDELNKWPLLLNNVENLIKYDDKVKIEVLANSEAVSFYINENQKIKELLSMGVGFVACQNSLNSRNIKTNNLIIGIKAVPVGVYELTIKQSEGFAYIKP